MAPTTPSTAGTQWETIAQACERTGFADGTIRDLINSGRLPAYRLSDRPRSRLRLKVAEVDALMQPFIPSENYVGKVGL
ncbi:excisionase family DNA-binding protein [Gordonia terrae]|uniref:excisionase family DNA-binding protein n=1 Tax=Gordonia hongkongensis TaxID=1701090 RepID=UPI0022B492D0|nr:excisionase family DNA-binding protein [Gordonia terrae]